ncbi:VWA domain-containing protein [Aeromonas rivipollensis]|uniref:VWA domain-containing protein n=1 Tax=Aeromonas rivipollensis TaxID=948519 RepID=UPI001F242601|nr:VWA domain-containing protein [Aeromonas rivipollensis]MCE9942213.1 VWA domain-containing protein [Aeromonas rivipollensis]
MILAWPWFALALALPLLVRFGLPPLSRAGRARLAHAGFPLLLPQAGQPLWRMALCWCALVLALCRPQWQEAPLIHYQASRDLILAVDLSDSMRTQDMLDEGEQRDRLSAVRQQIAHLIGERPGDRIALIVFADHAYLLSPLTQETRALLALTRELDFDLVGRTTALGEAILLARQHADPARPTALLLITDGRNTAGNAEPLTEARRAAAAGIRLYTLGVGADPDTFSSPLGGADPSAELDEPLLQQLAELGHGRYFRARSQADLSAINQAIDTLEPAARPQTLYRPHQELYPWPLALAWLLLVWPARLRWPVRRTGIEPPESPHE